jgi:type II secretion system protein I
MMTMRSANRAATVREREDALANTPLPHGRGSVRRGSANGRHALTLLEVIVAMAIFLISVIAILQLVTIGSERALDVRLQMRTSMRCQSKLAEVMIGAETLRSSGSYTNFTDGIDNDLQWKIDATPTDPNQLLWTVKVSVKADLSNGKTVESQLIQMVLNPANRGSTLDPPTPPATTATTGTN